MELIRPAIATDCDAILSLIKELAVFEKMPDQVEMTTATLIKDGFEADPKFSCLVAEINEAIVAYALYYPTYSTWKGSTMYLDDLYVTPSARRRGIGAKMFKAVAKAAVNRGCKRLEWTCLEWNKNAICMYEKLGGENLTKKEEWNFFRLNDSQLFHLVGQEN